MIEQEVKEANMTTSYISRWVLGYLSWVQFARERRSSIESQPMMFIVNYLYMFGCMMLVCILSAPIWTFISFPNLALDEWILLSGIVIFFEFTIYLLTGLTLATIWTIERSEFWLKKPFWI